MLLLYFKFTFNIKHKTTQSYRIEVKLLCGLAKTEYTINIYGFMSDGGGNKDNVL